MNAKKKILIVDDHPLFRKGIKAVLTDYENVTVIGEAGSGEEAFSIIEKLHPDIIVLDLQLPGMSGVDLSRKVKAIFPDTKIILLTMHKEEGIFNKSFEYGIDAYLLKENAVDEVIKAIEVVSEGNYYLSPLVAQYLMKQNINEKKLAKENSGMQYLTEKEKEVLQFIAMNKTTKEIASELFLSSKTIENHRANICKKLNISGPNALLKFIIENKNRL